MATVIRNQKLFCTNCGDEKTLVYPIAVDDMTTVMKSFEDRHKDCKPEWTEPKPSPNTSPAERAQFWFDYCEQGASSKTIYYALTNQWLKIKTPSHPCDPDDFSRCYKLLQIVPEFKSQLHKLKKLSTQWEKLVDNWDKLTEMYEQNVKEDWKNPMEIGMYKFMQKLGC